MHRSGVGAHARCRRSGCDSLSKIFQSVRIAPSLQARARAHSHTFGSSSSSCMEVVHTCVPNPRLFVVKIIRTGAAAAAPAAAATSPRPYPVAPKKPFVGIYVPRRSSRRRVRDEKTKKWAERSVWSMVCAIELGLVQSPTITSFPIKPETTATKLGWTGKPSVTLEFVPKSNDSTATTTISRFAKSQKIDRRNDDPDEHSQNHSSLREHRYSLPPISNFSENSDTTKIRNILGNDENIFSGETKVHNSFDDPRDRSEKSVFRLDDRYIDERNENSCANDGFANDRKMAMTETSENRVFPKNWKNSSFGGVATKRRYFRRNRKVSTCLPSNERTDTIVTVARVRPRIVHTDFSKIGINDADRSIENRMTSIAPSDSSSDDSTDSDVRSSTNRRKKNCFNQEKSCKKSYKSNWRKNIEKSKSAEMANNRKRRYRRKPIRSRSNDAINRSTAKIRSNDDDSDKENGGIARTYKNCKLIENRRRTKVYRRNAKKSQNKRNRSLVKSSTIEVGKLPIDYEDSEVDENFLVDPSTDLPDALRKTNDHEDEPIDLSPSFDVDFDINFQTNAMSTSLDVLIDRQDSTRHKKNNDTPKHFNRSNMKNRWEKSVLKKTEKHFSPVVDPKKRRSADWIVAKNSNEINVDNDAKATTRITRGSLKNFVEKNIEENIPIEWEIGTLVWGNCMGWWPGLIVDAEDVGMCSSDEKNWIYWIGEDRISHLRSKTQIQSFSIGLRSRMIEILRTKTRKDANYTACMSTIKLVNDQLLQRGPLTKPHHAWVEKHLLNHENIDRLVLHPYPPNVQKRLDDLRTKNFLATEKYLAVLNAEIPEETLPIVSQKSTSKSLTNPEQGHLPLASQKPGVITWAKIMGQIWWPAMIIDFRDCGMNEPNFGCQWILWYGDYTLSQVNHRFFLAFDKGMTRMKDYVVNCKRELYRRGVIEAAKDFCSQYGYKTDDWTMTEIIDWFAKLDDDEEPQRGLRANALPGIPANVEPTQKYPSRILEGLRKHKGNCTVAAIRQHNIKDSDDLRSVIHGKSNVEKLCLMCLKNCDAAGNADNTVEHPFFDGSLCGECSEKYTPTIFAYGDDGKCFFCTVCAGSDTVVMCDEQDCPRVYCTACLKYLIAPKTYDDIMINDPFVCFVCERSENLMMNGLIKPREDWKIRVARLFGGNRDSVPKHVEYYKNVKTKLRVLSLFDGISSGLVVLDKLGMKVEAYYASEIDPDAEMVSSAHFGDRIVRLGDVRSITEDKIREIGPINLLIGGSPCNDLSLVNPTRLGLHDPNGTGILVFEYRRIKNLVEKINDDKHYFWLFENVASMPSKYRLEINEHLGREPDLIDAANYSPQHRPRLYWNNFPIVSYPLSSQDLQDVLTPNCNRHALVKKIQTVTTRVNSLKQGKDSLKPILMNEENDNLWITELEEIFGFPRHYTDVKNLCATKRQKLIGKSWSVQTIAELMRPLCNFFQGRDQES